MGFFSSSPPPYSSILVSFSCSFHSLISSVTLHHHHSCHHPPTAALFTFLVLMKKIFQTHPLDLHEIRSRIATSLGLKDLASCALVSQDWNDSFTPSLYKSVVLSKHGPSMESVERNKHLIKHLNV